ncbi:carbon storage regulator [Botrimarina hoheduenensis]|uniref:Translational regulator CsrA n=1 Tax=Botrimarina hoheduenensis TaxID=2528000 RepID=A0A5C5VRQ8_9BACT|nr:carbon storage regulator [Botrimarina hoheduenensis]TWT41316.1 Carbon storage regulator [Botrimarina hoheduenensis]
MLVLSRRTDELIRIGDHILLRVLGVKGSVVRLGIDAPADLPILRGELLACEPAIYPGSVTVPVPKRREVAQDESIGAT